MDAIERYLEIGGKRWQKNGKDRIYFNGLAELFGLECSRYNTGNISSATLDGDGISNCSARNILTSLEFGKLWFEVGEGKFYFTISDCRDFTGSEMGNAIITEIKRRAAENVEVAS